MITALLLSLGLAAPTPQAPSPDRPLAALPYTPGFDVSSLDRAHDPCVDFYAFACGGWQKRNPVPPDKGRWDAYQKAEEENLRFLWGILEAAAAPGGARTPVEAKVGDAFAACMDEVAVERAGAAPLRDDLAAIEALRSTSDFARVAARLHLTGVGDAWFGFSAEPSFEDSDRMVAWLDAGGLGLPDRDLYVLGDRRSKDVRAAYAAHVAQMLRLAGRSRDAAARGARAVVRIETALAHASLTRTERREPERLWHPTALADLARAARAFRWADYLEASGAPPLDRLNVAEPAFLAELSRLLSREPLPAWKDYLRWHAVRARAPYLSRPFQAASFAFYGAKLRGAKEIAPRWKRCVQWIDRDLGEALGQLFVERVFPPAVKADIEVLVGHVREAMRRHVEALDWMTPETKARAQEKLAAMRNKIGYPARWRDYSALEVRRDDFAGNVARGLAFEAKRVLAKIGKPVDRDEWHMTPPTVNAYYDPSMNDMNFPAGVLLPPEWDPRIDVAPGYGNTGGTVGHELSHGFDDEGRHFDAKGNLRDWWTEADAKEFVRRGACIVAQYAEYPVIDEVKINSRLTLGEDIADLAGLLLAHDAWRAATAGKTLAPADGFTPEQRFFVGYAQGFCANERPEDLRLRALTDPHSPPRWRVNGVVANMPEFGRAFSCPQRAPMVRSQVCRVW